MMSRCLLVIFSLLFLSFSVQSLYEDQAGRNDWYKENIGNIERAQFASSKRVLVSTNQNFLAALNLATGNTFWRQHQPNDEEINYIQLYESNEVLTVSGKAQRIALWDTGSGALIWDTFTATPLSVSNQAQNHNFKFSVDVISEKSLVVLLVNNWLRVHDMKNGNLLWNKTLPTDIDNNNNKDQEEEDDYNNSNSPKDQETGLQHLQYHLFRGSNLNVNNKDNANNNNNDASLMKESVCLVGVHEKQNNRNHRTKVRTLLEMCFTLRTGKKSIRATKEKFTVVSEQIAPPSSSTQTDSFSLPFQCVATSHLLVCLSNDKKHFYTYQLGSHSIVSFPLSEIDPLIQISFEEDLPRLENVVYQDDSTLANKEKERERETGVGEYIIIRGSSSHTLLLRLKPSSSHLKPVLTYSFQSKSELTRVFGPIVRGPDAEFYLPSAFSDDESSRVEILAISTGKIDWFPLSSRPNPPISSVYLIGKGVDFKSVRKVFLQKVDGTVGVWQSVNGLNLESVEPQQLDVRNVWERQEVLASLNRDQVQLLDLPHDERSFYIQTLKHEFDRLANSTNVIRDFIYRVSSELQELYDFINTLQERFLSGDKPSSNNSNNSDNNGLFKDTFGMNKLIIGLSSSCSTVVGISSRNSQLVWKTYLPKVVPVKLIITRLPLHTAECTIVATNKKDGRSVLIKLDAMSGAVKSTEYLPFQIKQSFVLNQYDSDHNRIFALMDLEDNVHFYPPNEEVIQEFKRSGYLYYIKDNSISGYTLHPSFSSTAPSSPDSAQATLFWSTAFNEAEEKIIGVSFPNENEHVHSFVRILGDRSVLVKYLNRNMIVVGTQFVSINSVYNEENQEKEEKVEQTISIYLIDTVTGNVIERFIHRGASLPFSLVSSENFVVYSYWNTKSFRFEVSVLELFENADPFNLTTFSSFEEHKLNILQQSYIYPSPVLTMAVTMTRQGITAKQILFGHNSGQIVAIDKKMLDPRRPRKEDFSADDREEGLVPYNPLLTPPHTTYLTYNKTVARLRGIRTAGTDLESQSVVFAYGTDLFFTVVTPAKEFDVLSDDFNHTTLILTVTLLVICTILSQWLIKRKELAQAWK